MIFDFPFIYFFFSKVQTRVNWDTIRVIYSNSKVSEVTSIHVYLSGTFSLYHT